MSLVVAAVAGDAPEHVVAKANPSGLAAQGVN